MNKIMDISDSTINIKCCILDGNDEVDNDEIPRGCCSCFGRPASCDDNGNNTATNVTIEEPKSWQATQTPTKMH